MAKQQYICPKCGNTHYESDQFQATGGNFSKIFDVQNKNLVQDVVIRNYINVKLMQVGIF